MVEVRINAKLWVTGIIMAALELMGRVRSPSTSNRQFSNRISAVHGYRVRCTVLLEQKDPQRPIPGTRRALDGVTEHAIRRCSNGKGMMCVLVPISGRPIMYKYKSRDDPQ